MQIHLIGINFKVWMLLVLVPLSIRINAQINKIAQFKDGERVCFIGNSITHAGDFHHNIFLYYLTRFPERNILFFNNGISGDVTAGILNRMDDDILIHKPTTAVIMIGMNDVVRNLYTLNISPAGDTMQRRAQALITYKSNLDSIVRLLIKNHIRVILQQPSIYDQTAKLPKENSFGANDALKICADYMQELANKYKLDIVDYWTIMSDINTKLQKTDSSATIVGGDRIHPGAVGNLVMAYQFIHTTQLPVNTINTVIEDNIKKSNRESYRIKLLKLKIDFKEVSFTSNELSLPFPVITRAIQALQLVPLSDSINREILQVKHLATGNYQLRIDNNIVGSFTSGQLEEGINMAIFTNTPQYQKSLAIRKFLDEKYFPTEANYRSIKFFEYRNIRNVQNKLDTAAVRAYVYGKNSANISTIKSAIDKYFDYKPQQQALLNSLTEYNRQAHEMAKSQSYNYILTKIE